MSASTAPRADPAAASTSEREWQRRLARAEYDLTRLREEKALLERQLSEARMCIEDLGVIVAQKEERSNALLRSWSWKLTSPLRVLARWLWFGLRRKTPAQPAAVLVPATRSEYETWLARYKTVGAVDEATMQRDISAWSSAPRLSILMPVYNTPEPWLRRAIESVLAQTYPHWQLCIADDASSDPCVRELLNWYARRDQRIHVVLRDQNGHIAAASNTALSLATGDFVCLLDHDDELAPQALYVLAKAILACPEADLFYSDEDKIDTQGRRLDPYFKPDWNPDLFLAYNFFNHFAALRMNLMRELGGFRVGFEGSEDYDLVLRAVARVGAEKVRHIPHVLYHWRVIPGSAAASHREKPYALPAAIKAVREHLQNQCIRADVEESAPSAGTIRVRYALPDPAPLVSIIIPTRDGYTLLRNCIDSILARTHYPNYEILIVDNGSDDPQALAYLQALAMRGQARVLTEATPFNYSALNNIAARAARGPLLCLMNNDVEVITPDWLQEMASQALRPEIGMVGCRLWYPDDTIQHAGIILGIGGVAGHAHHRTTREQNGYFSRAQLVQNYSAVTAACAVVRAEVYRQVGGLDEQLPVAFNDVDLCLRIRDAGYRNLWTPYAELYHHESASRGLEDTPEKQARFAEDTEYMVRRYATALLHDPAYNPNLALRMQDYTLAYPPRIERLAVTAGVNR